LFQTLETARNEHKTVLAEWQDRESDPVKAGQDGKFETVV